MATSREQQDQNTRANTAPAVVVPVAAAGDKQKARDNNPNLQQHSTALGNLSRELDQLAQKMAAGAGNSADGHAALVAEVSAMRDRANEALSADEPRQPE